MLCSKCSLRNECKVLCEDVIKLVGEEPQKVEDREKYYPKKVTTFTDMEVKFSNKTSRDDSGGFYDWVMHIAYENDNSTNVDTTVNRSKQYRKYVPIVKDILNQQVTARQREVFNLWVFEEKSYTNIGKQLGISYQAVQQTIYGHSKHGGGVLKKIQKKLKSQHGRELFSDGKIQNYL